jgi:hypothetical protein
VPVHVGNDGGVQVYVKPEAGKTVLLRVIAAEFVPPAVAPAQVVKDARLLKSAFVFPFRPTCLVFAVVATIVPKTTCTF